MVDASGDVRWGNARKRGGGVDGGGVDGGARAVERARVRAVVGGSRGARADVRSRARWCYNGTEWIGRSGERGLETVGVVETEIFEGAVVLAPSVAHLDLNV